MLVKIQIEFEQIYITYQIFPTQSENNKSHTQTTTLPIFKNNNSKLVFTEAPMFPASEFEGSMYHEGW